MSHQNPSQKFLHAQLTTQDNKETLHQHHLERLARLFRHVGESKDDRYLLNLMIRYRTVESS